MQAVKPEIQARAHVSGMDAYESLYRRSIDQPESFWSEVATRLDWMSKPTKVMDTDFEAGRFEWFSDGTLNVSHNCLDRHLETAANKVAIIWAKDDVGEYEHITYGDLHRRVCKTANGLRSLGVGAGDRVCLYLPMIPELAVFMLACARIGAIHSVVFAGFSATALRDRIVDAAAKVVVTADEGLRGGRVIPLAKTTFEATRDLEIETIVVERTGAGAQLRRDGDIDYGPWVAEQPEACEPAEMKAEDPLFILYTSGSTGRPKGVVHSSGGYLVYASYTHELVFDLHDDDVYFCAADCGWITGHSYIVYGPLANQATTVMFESTPLYPDASRYWRIVQDLGITIFYTAPTAIRAIARAGTDPVAAHDRSSLRVLGSVGEPINPEVWRWYHDVVGDSRCAIVDTWWQTETGGIMITPLPGATPTKPGSATFPLPGIEPVVVNEQNEVIEGNDVRGILCLGRGWPGQARTIWGDHPRFLETYYRPFAGRYFTGDGCERDADGYYWITGRVDDVINVSGHRLGTAEVESALVAHDDVAEAAVVGYPHPIKGTGIFAYVVTKPGVDLASIRADLVTAVRKDIGPIATPDVLQEADGLPKTRSGKIMRRILRKVAAAEYEALGDTSTLADPSVVERIVAAHKAASES